MAYLNAWHGKYINKQGYYVEKWQTMCLVCHIILQWYHTRLLTIKCYLTSGPHLKTLQLKQTAEKINRISYNQVHTLTLVALFPQTPAIKEIHI
jgi:hypothetical protein